MWANPWAWLGLAGLAVPVAIHLLARHRAARTPFPSLRFISATDLNAVSRHRLTDIPLLLLRLLLVLLAVIASAGPRLGAAAPASSVAEVHVVDRSDSAEFATRIDVMPPFPVVATTSLPAGIRAAAAWAARRPGPSVIVVESDFQLGALTSRDLAAVPAPIGLRFARVGSVPAPMPQGFQRSGDTARMTWAAAQPVVPESVDAVSAEPADGRVTLAAAMSVTPLTWPGMPVTFVFAGAPDFDRRASDVQPIRNIEMYEASAAAVRDSGGRVTAGADHRGLVIIDQAPAGTADAVETVSRVFTGANGIVPPGESETRTISDADLQSWTREPADTDAGGGPRDAASNGRWFWMAVVILLAAETFVRRRAA